MADKSVTVRLPFEIRRSHTLAAAIGVAHAAVLLTYAFGLGRVQVTLEGLGAVAALVYTVSGMVLLAAVPAYLLFEYSLVLPVAVFALNLALLVRGELAASPDGALAFQFVVWVVPFALVLLVGGVEYALRRWIGPPPTPLLG